MRIQASQLADTLAFVVMPDHMHWLLQLGSNQNLSRVVGSMKSGSSRQMRRRRQPGASIWQSGFHDRALRCDEDLAQVARYIIANPLRAGLVERIGDYPLWDAVWLDMT
jgi:REP-associated tyrosine transposase